MIQGYDASGIGPSESMVFAYDLDGDGNYDDYQTTGSLTSNGSTVFNSIGTHSVGVRLTDGLGGTTYGNFDVQVLLQPVPEPASLAIFGTIGLLACGRRRKS